MSNQRHHFIGLVIVLCATGCSTLGSALDKNLGTTLGMSTPAPRDHYDPGYLNEAAAAAWAKGDHGTALLLLERAAVIAPQDSRIVKNLETVKRAGGRDVLMHYGASPNSGVTGEAEAKAAAIVAATRGINGTPVAPVSDPRADAAPEIGFWPLK